MSLVDTIGADLCVRVVQTLIHFLWQGLLIAVAVAGLNGIARRRSAAFRYWVAATAMLMMAACLPATFLALAPETPHVTVQHLQHDAPPEASTRQVASPINSFVPRAAVSSTVARQIAEPAISAAGEPPRQTPSQFWVAASPYIVGIYVIGVLLMMTRLAIAFGGGERLRRSSLPIEESHVLEVLRSKAAELGLRAAPALACCERVATPIIVGVMKPTILLPFCLLSELSLAQIEAVLAHELAHVRRWDHVANLAQRIIESLLFFHPAVWYVSRYISKERENCCDDIVLASGAKAAGYAELLVRVAEMNQARSRQSVAALAASDSHRSRLHERVVRVLGGGIETPFRLRRTLASTSAVTFTMIAIGVLCMHAAGVNDQRFGDFNFDNPPAAYEKEIRAADAQHYIKAGSVQFKLSKFTRGKDDSLDASLGLPKAYEVVSFRLFDHAKRKLIHDSHWQLNKDNDPSTRRFHVARIGETARITIRETGGELPAEIDLWLRIVENGEGKPIMIPAKQGAVVKVGDAEIAVTSLLAGNMSGKSNAAGQIIWDVSSAHDTKWTTTINLQNRGEDLRGRYHLVAVTKSGWRHAMDHKHFLEFPRHRGRFDYVQLDVGLDDIDHFELVPFKDRHKFFFNAVSVPPPLPHIGSTVERWIDDQLNRAGNNFLDFETGTLSTLPAAHWETTPPGKDAEQWIAASGVDALGDFRSGLTLLRSKAKLIAGTWEAITIDDVRRTLADATFNSKAAYSVDRSHDPNGKKFADGQGLLAPPRHDESAIHAFETAGGTVGIIQIAAVDRKTKRQKVRYKLFQVATAADQAVETGLRPAPAFLSGSEQYVAGQPMELRLKTIGGADWQLDQSRGEIDSDEHWACYVRINGKDYRCRSVYFPFSGPIASTLTLPGDLQNASPFSPGFYRVSYVWKDIDVIRTSDGRQTHLDEYVSEACAISVVDEVSDAATNKTRERDFRVAAEQLASLELKSIQEKYTDPDLRLAVMYDSERNGGVEFEQGQTKAEHYYLAYLPRAKNSAERCAIYSQLSVLFSTNWRVAKNEAADFPKSRRYAAAAIEAEPNRIGKRVLRARARLQNGPDLSAEENFAGRLAFYKWLTSWDGTTARKHWLPLDYQIGREDRYFPSFMRLLENIIRAETNNLTAVNSSDKQPHARLLRVAGEVPGTDAAKIAQQKLDKLWGAAADGVQAMLVVEQRDWANGETPELKAMIRNGGQSDYEVAQAQQLCELEVNDRRYRWVGTIRVRSSSFPPGKQFDNIPVTLDGSWHDKRTDDPLKLDVGRHTIRLAFTPSRRETGRTVTAPFLVLSNPVEVRVVTKKADVGWGPVIERELTIDADQATAYLNLTTGKQITPTWGALPDAKTLRAAGVDVYHASVLSNHTQKMCLDVEHLTIEDGWALTASKINELLDRAKLARKTKQGILDPNVTYLFETRDGSRGVLELVPDKAKATVLTVRYKLVAKGGENKADATNDKRRNDDGSRALIGAWSGGQKVMQRLVFRADGTFELSYPKTPRIVDVIPELGVWSSDGRTLTLEISTSADPERVGKKIAREIVYPTDKSMYLRAEDGVCTLFTPARVFHGWTLLRWQATTEVEGLIDFWEERPAGSKSYEVRPDVDVIYSGVDGTIYYRADKKRFLIQSDPIGSSTRTFYGPYEGDPRKLLKLPERNEADDKQPEGPRTGAAADEPSEDASSSGTVA